MDKNVCEQCGGVTGPVAREVARTLHALQAQGKFACPGHPEPTPKHNGLLDEFDIRDNRHAAIEIQQNPTFWNGPVWLYGGYGDCESRCISLNPQQALSLLAYLEQKRPVLEQMVKEYEKK